MPKKYNKKKKSYQRKYYKRKYKQSSWSGNSTALVRRRIGIPEENIVRFRYAELINLNPGAGTLATYRFSANNMNDPRYETGGHQPLGYDEWANFYEKAVVIGSRIMIQPVYEATNSNNGVVMGILLSNDGTLTATTVEELVEQGMSTYRVIPAVNYAPGDNANPIVNSYSLKKFFDVENVKDNYDTYGSLMNTDIPTEAEAIYHIWVGGMDANDLAGFNVLVTIEYIALLTSPMELAQSS